MRHSHVLLAYFTVLLGVIAVVGGCGVESIQRETGSEERLGGRIGRLLQKESECSIEANTDYPGDIGIINDGKDTILFSSQDCCKLCEETEDCKVWTYIKKQGKGSQRGECWMRNVVPTKTNCRFCDSGLKKQQSTTDILDECEADGKTAGSQAVYRGGCAVLQAKCPPPPPDRKRTPFPERKSAADLADDVVERTCKVLFEEACKKEATLTARADTGDCGNILTKGPGAGSTDCKSIFDVVEIFDDTVKGLCVKDD